MLFLLQFFNDNFELERIRLLLIYPSSSDFHYSGLYIFKVLNWRGGYFTKNIKRFSLIIAKFKIEMETDMEFINLMKEMQNAME